MTPTKALPLLFLLSVGSLTTATLAFAQTGPDASGTPAAEVVQADFEDERGPRHGPGGRGERGGMMFGAAISDIDADGDGAITQDEIDLFRAALVGGADASGDGAIDLAEFEAIFVDLARDRMVDQFQDLDADGSGSVTQAEMDTRFGGIVARMDRNGDGLLNADDRGGRDGDGRRGDHGPRDSGGPRGDHGPRDGGGPRDRG